MKISEFLKSVRANMSPETWTKEALCRDSNGNKTIYLSDAACSFCLYGYLYRTEYLLEMQGKDCIEGEVCDEVTDLILKANPQLSKVPGEVKLVTYNDDPNTTFDDIVKVIDNSIQYAEVKGL